MIEPILVRGSSQRLRADRLVAFCRELDGTKVTVLDADDSVGNWYPQRGVNAFHQAAAHAKGRPFLWLEADSIPLRPGWLDAISAEYERVGKPILLHAENNPPHDLAGGIGVYPPESHWLFPKSYRFGAWDLWMEQHLQPLIGRTRLLQHSYGLYDAKGDASPHRFPRDAQILRPETLLFHRDRYQDLIPRAPGKTSRFLHYGDLGDAIAALPAVRALGGGDFICSYQPKAQRESLAGARFDALRPLLEAQPYIYQVEWEDDPQAITHDFNGFRFQPRASHLENLAQWQARFLGVENVNLDPWLTVPDFDPHGRIVVARSLRYHNRFFPWDQIAYKFRSEIAFVGLPEEHAELSRIAGFDLPYHRTSDLLQLAQFIAGAKLFIGNQSAPFWVAAGLGVPLVQESWPQEQNSIVQGPAARFTLTAADTRALIYSL